LTINSMAGSGFRTRWESHELSPDLQERLKEALGSYEELQLLLYARGQPGPWSLQDASRRLHLDEGALTEALDCLLAAGFLWTVEDGGPEKRFTYPPLVPGARGADRAAGGDDRRRPAVRLSS
jgi:hypothetical protein